MTKRVILLVIVAIVFEACIVEPSTVFYNFEITNRLDQKLIIKYHRKGYKNRSETDTIYPNAGFETTQSSFDCYDEKLTKDSLIYNFFDTLIIFPMGKAINLNPFHRQYWKDSLVLENKSIQKCLKGNAYFFLSIDTAFLKTDHKTER